MAPETVDLFSMVREGGAMVILAWVVFAVTKRIVDRLDSNTSALNKLANAIKDAHNDYKTVAIEQSRNLHDVVVGMDKTLAELANEIREMRRDGSSKTL